MLTGSSRILVRALLLSLLTSTGAHADWLQYRHGADRNAVVAGDLQVPNDRVTVLDTPNGVRATPTVIGHDLLIGNNESGEIQRIDPATGKTLWQIHAPNWVHSETIWSGHTAVTGYGNRFFTSDEDPAVPNYARGTGPGGVLATNPATGAIRWQYRTLGEVMPTPVIVGDSVYVAGGDRAIHVLSLADGHQRDLIRLGSFVSMSSPALDDSGRLFVGGGDPYRLFAINTGNNQPLWHADFPDMIGGVDDVPPAVGHAAEQEIVVTSGVFPTATKGRFEHRLFALNASTGQRLWQASLGIGGPVKNNRSGAPVIHADQVVVGSPTSNTLSAFSLTTGKRQWQLETGPIKAPPVIAHGRVYATTTKARLLVVNATTGKLITERRLGDKPLAPAGPILVGNDLVVPSQDSHVYIVPLSLLTAS
ncbi:MAG: PQQ-binding-like beta-propeller repeat protein [Salinisphaera sp.]|jgi:outer membrane protein assembly factor BamB|nr:PQQ-binding-like beta-propeller repeat protein [Salinisphaera sp.]